MMWCVTVNPSLDITYQISGRLQPGGIYRTEPLERSGGKGNNVARAVAFGAPGHCGGDLRWIHGACHLRPRATDGHSVLLRGIRRGESPMLDGCGKRSRNGNSRTGPRIPLPTGKALLSTLLKAVRTRDWVMLSGSLPVGWLDETYAEWIHALKSPAAGILLDTSGLPLRRGVEAQPTAIIPNQVEFQELDRTTMGDVHMIITRRPEGAVWLSPSGDCDF